MLEEIAYSRGWPKGEHQDILLGPTGEVIWTRSWQSNTIVNGLREVLAGLIKGDPAVKPLNYWAVGTGDPAWDNGARPEGPELVERTQLYNEVARKELGSDQITFVGGTLSNQLQIRADFVAADISGSDENRKIREFGLFANGGTDSNSGMMINHRVHPRIDLQEGFPLQRILLLTF